MLLGLLFVALTLVMFRPGWSALRTTLPANLGDPALIVWIYRWEGHALVHGGAHFYNANIFWPRPHTLAYAENMISTSPAYNALYDATGSWAASLNITVLALVVMCLAATYALAKWLTRRVDAAVLAAIAFTFSGFVLGHWGATQLYALGFFPLAFLLLFRTLHERRPVMAVLAGLAIAALVLGSLYYGAIFSWCAAVVVAGYLVAHRFRPGPGVLRSLAITGVVAGVLIAPNAVPYWRVHNDLHFERSYAPAWGLKAVDFVSPAPGSYLYPGLARAADHRTEAFEHRFFAGFSVMLLAAIGLGALVRARLRRTAAEARSEPDPRRLFLWLTVLGGFAALIPASGPTILGHAGPFRLFHDYWPGFSGLRVTARLAVPALLSFAVLAAFGFDTLTRHTAQRTRLVAAVGVGALMLLEFAAPLHHAPLATDPATLAVYRALAHRPAGAAVEIPMADPRVDGKQWALVEAPRMVYSTIDFHPRVNGYSGYIPPGYYESINAFNAFPAPAALQRASQLNVRYVVLHVGQHASDGTLGPRRAADMLAALPPSSSARRYGDSWLVDLTPSRSGG
ncbi:MAG: hypothetical protein JOZ99_13610 [Actinobacteria bacterium]|nr:hypothetical protein [Actinomycetota bacterium]